MKSFDSIDARQSQRISMRRNVLGTCYGCEFLFYFLFDSIFILFLFHFFFCCCYVLCNIIFGFSLRDDGNLTSISACTSSMKFEFNFEFKIPIKLISAFISNSYRYERNHLKKNHFVKRRWNCDK